MNEQQAKTVASEFLAELSAEFRSGAWVIVGVEEHATAWSVGYQSRSFVETGRIVDSLVGNGPVVVPKSGEPPWMAWSGRPAKRHRLRPTTKPSSSPRVEPPSEILRLHLVDIGYLTREVVDLETGEIPDDADECAQSDCTELVARRNGRASWPRIA